MILLIIVILKFTSTCHHVRLFLWLVYSSHFKIQCNTSHILTETSARCQWMFCDHEKRKSSETSSMSVVTFIQSWLSHTFTSTIRMSQTSTNIHMITFPFNSQTCQTCHRILSWSFFSSSIHSDLWLFYKYWWWNIASRHRVADIDLENNQCNPSFLFVDMIHDGNRRLSWNRIDKNSTRVDLCFIRGT